MTTDQDDGIAPDLDDAPEDADAPPVLNAEDPVDAADAAEEADAVDDGDDETAVSTTAGDGEDEEALDELEAEELEMLTEDEASETLVADEAAEMRAIRRAEIAMEQEEASGAGADEFVCSSCFLVLKRSQRAGPRKSICRDCAA